MIRAVDMPAGRRTPEVAAHEGCSRRVQSLFNRTRRMIYPETAVFAKSLIRAKSGTWFRSKNRTFFPRLRRDL